MRPVQYAMNTIDMTVDFFVKPVMFEVTIDVSNGKLAEKADARQAPATRATRCFSGMRNIIPVPVILMSVSIRSFGGNKWHT
jgi:hypothetical protein